MQDIWEATPNGSQLDENHYSKQRCLSSELYVPGFPQANLREFRCIWYLQHHSPLYSSMSLIKYIFDAAYCAYGTFKTSLGATNTIVVSEEASSFLGILPTGSSSYVF